MPTRWFNVAVVVFWMSTMSWLFTQKIWPSLDRGDPPGYGSRETPVRWELFINGRPLGWATNDSEEDADGVIQYRSRVHLIRLPFAEVVPAWLSQSLGAPLADTSMELESTTEVDPLERLIGFRSTVSLGPAKDVVTIEGKADGDLLKLKVRSAQFVHHRTISLPPQSPISDAFCPSTYLGRLRVGQEWTIPVYSPFRPPTAPVEILHARVEREEPIVWNSEVVNTRLVVYSGDSNSAHWHARTWVAKDGRVLKQQMAVINAYVTFIRLPPDVTGETIQGAAAGSD